MTVERIAYSPTEAAKMLGVSRAWMYLRLDDGTIPSVKLAGRRLIRREDLDRILSGEHS
jgi:excisionase family DNA binding protein